MPKKRVDKGKNYSIIYVLKGKLREKNQQNFHPSLGAKTINNV